MKGRGEKFPAAFQSKGLVRSVAAVVFATLILILGVAVKRAGSAARCSTDGSTFEGIAPLMADNAAKHSTCHRACDSTALCVGAGWFGAVTKGEGA